MASRGVNKAIIIGNLGTDPELRETTNGTPVCRLSIATSEQWKDKTTGEPREETEWHRIVLWQRLAEIAAQYLQKGSRVYVEGKLQTRKWTDQQGMERFTTEIRADNMQMLDGGNSPPAKSAAQRAPQQRLPVDPFQAPADYDNDIPF
jgi:single-strand DNA-binding protein